MLFGIVHFGVAQNDYKTKVENLVEEVKKHDQTNIPKAIELHKELLSLAKKNNDTLLFIKELHILARRNQFIGEHYNSIKLFKEELSILNSIESDSINKILKELVGFNNIEIEVQLGNNYSAIGEPKLALDYFHNAEKKAIAIDNEFYKVIIPVLIANMHYQAEEYKKAITIYKKSIEDLQVKKPIDENNIKFNSAIIYNVLGSSYLKIKEIDSAKLMLKTSLDKGYADFSPMIRTGYETILGDIYFEEEDYKKALQQYTVAKNKGDKYNLNSGLLSTYKQISKTYEKLNKVDSAIYVLNKGINLIKQNSKEFMLSEDYKELARLYKTSGDTEKSNEFYEKYIFNQAELEKNKQDIISTFHNKEVEEITTAKENQERTNRNLLIAGISVIVLLLGTLVFIINKRKKEKIHFESLLSKINTSEKQEEKTTIIVDTKDAILESTTTSDISEETTQEILDGLQKLEAQEYYLKQECNSHNVAKKIKTNTSYLSKVVNSHYQKNFNTYINDLRINYTILRLKNDSQFRSYTIQSIANEVGYKSADSFTKYFKKHTGLNPSFYIKKLNSLA